MATNVDFSKLLAKPVDQIKKVPALPAGTYDGVIQKYEFGESTQKKTPYVRFFLGVTAARDDVDPADLAEIDLSKKILRSDFYITDDSEYRLKDFLETLGIDSAGRTLGEMIPESINQGVVMSVTQRNNPNDPEQIYNDIAKIVGV